MLVTICLLSLRELSSLSAAAFKDCRISLLSVSREFLMKEQSSLALLSDSASLLVRKLRSLSVHSRVSLRLGISMRLEVQNLLSLSISATTSLLAVTSSNCFSCSFCSSSSSSFCRSSQFSVTFWIFFSSSEHFPRYFSSSFTASSFSRLRLLSQKLCSCRMASRSFMSSTFRYSMSLSFSAVSLPNSSACCLRRLSDLSLMILFSSFRISILFSRLLMIDCSSNSRLFITFAVSRIKYNCKMQEQQDFFETVHQQLQEWPGEAEEGWLQECSLRERLDSTNAFGGTCFLNRSLLKRKQDRSLRKSREGRYPVREDCQPEFSAVALKMGNISKMGEQLKRLEKGLTYEKPKPANPRSSRQKKLIRRIERSNKENSAETVEISSLELQQYRQQNQQLSEVFIQLFRFYEQQLEQNELLETATTQIEQHLESEEQQLQQQRERLKQLRLQMEAEREGEQGRERELFGRLRLSWVGSCRCDN